MKNKIVIGGTIALILLSPFVAMADAPYFTFSNPTFTGAGLTGNAANPYVSIYFFNQSGNNISGNSVATGRHFQATGGNFSKTLTDFGENGIGDGTYTVVVLTNVGATPSGEDSACGVGQDLTGCQNNWGYSPDSNSAASVVIAISLNPCASISSLSSGSLPCAITTVNSTWYGYFLTLLIHYWPFVVGVGVICAVWWFGRRLLNQFS